MAKASPKKISGFELPVGTLLNRVISEEATGFCHERSVSYKKSWHSHDRLTLAFPRGGSVIRYKSRKNIEIKIEPNQFVVLPANIEHMHWAESTVWNNFTLFPDKELIEEIGGVHLLKSLPDIAIYGRSHLLNNALEKLLHDALFRKLTEKELKPTYMFVLQLIFDEIRERATLSKKKEIVEERRDVNQVLIYLENRLFEDLDADEIAAEMGTSRATLYRNFKSLTGQSIMSYVRSRRMEEARQLMKSGNLRLSDIAPLVGYEDLYTFSTAYKNIFGVAPSKDASVHRNRKQSEL